MIFTALTPIVLAALAALRAPQRDSRTSADAAWLRYELQLSQSREALLMEYATYLKTTLDNERSEQAYH